MSATANPLQHLESHTQVLAKAAIQLGLSASIERRNDGQWWLHLKIGSNHYLYNAGVLLRASIGFGYMKVEHINGPGFEISNNKTRTIDVLAAAGISTPPGRTFNRSIIDEAFDYALALGPPVCVKPLFGAKGEAVFPNLVSPEWIRKALISVTSRCEEYRVEKHVGQQEIRYFYVAPKIVGVLIAETLTATGDGVSTVQQLLDTINGERLRRNQSSHVPIGWDEDRLALLASQGMAVDTVPAPGVEVQLSRTANRNRGGLGRDGRRGVDPSYARIAKAAFEAIPGLVMGAIDIRVQSTTIPAASDNYWVLEINSSPGVTAFHSLWDGEQDVAGPILRWLIADAKVAR